MHEGFTVIDNWFRAPQTNFLQKLVFINHLIETAVAFNESVNIHGFQVVIESLRNSGNAGIFLDQLENNLQRLNKSMSKYSAGTEVSDFALKNRYGKEFTKSDFENKILIIDVWASWCKPCISAFPKWNALVEHHSGNKYSRPYYTA